MNACHPYTVTSLIAYSIHSFGYCERTHIKHCAWDPQCSCLLIVVVCGSVIFALAVKVHRLRKYSKPDPVCTVLKYSMTV